MKGVSAILILALVLVGCGGKRGTSAPLSPVLTTLSVTPSNAAIYVGGTQAFSASGEDQNGNRFSPLPTLTWSSSSAAATINSGVATGVSAGTTNISASAAGVSSSLVTLTVSKAPSVLTTITVAPASASILVGATQSLSATGFDQYGNTLSGITFSWSSLNASAATVNAGGLVTGVAAGTAQILASADGINSNPATINVTAQYTISGTLVNLAGNSGGLVLQDNGKDNLPVNANGNFQFATTVTGGSAYNVTVLTQPSSPVQQCSVANGNGTATANVNNVKVDCGHNEWAWMEGSQAVNQIGTYGTLGSPAPANTPGGRQTPATWTDSSGNLWLFGGYGYDSSDTLMPMSDLWEFSAAEWTWKGGPTLAGQSGNYGSLGVASSSSIPGARFETVSWTDSSGDFWLFGGEGFDSVGTEASLNDLWKFSSGEWTWMGGSNVANQKGQYGTLGLANSNNFPGARDSAVIWKDASGIVWMFGGLGYDASSANPGLLNDLWKYSGGEWTWMGGANVQSQKGVYGTKGTAAMTNVPGARANSCFWTDASGDLWLFGGLGYDSDGNSNYLNDLWKYSAGQWTWVGGSNVVNGLSVYGTQGTAAANNIPGARVDGVAWADASGNGWLFGGSGFSAPSSVGFLNDLWKYSDGEWTWVSGSNGVNQSPTYGTEGTLAPGNTPGARAFLNGWVDANGNLWLIGGYGQETAATGDLNDLWMYMP